MVEKGKIILIEGVDGSGKATQIDILHEKLNYSGVTSCRKVSYPVYTSPTGRIIGQTYLGKRGLGKNLDWKGDYNWFGETDKVTPEVAILFYAAGRLYDLPNVLETINTGNHCLMDRYVPSNQAHQAGKYEDIKKRLQLINFIDKFEYDMLKLPRLDISIFLNLPFEIILERIKERGE